MEFLDSDPFPGQAVHVGSPQDVVAVNADIPVRVSFRRVRTLNTAGRPRPCDSAGALAAGNNSRS